MIKITRSAGFFSRVVLVKYAIIGTAKAKFRQDLDTVTSGLVLEGQYEEVLARSVFDLDARILGTEVTGL